MRKRYFQAFMYSTYGWQVTLASFAVILKGNFLCWFAMVYLEKRPTLLILYIGL